MIKELRKLFGISQTDLAAYLKITRSQLSMAEIGHRFIPTQKMLALVNFYKVMNGSAQQNEIVDNQLTSSFNKQNAKRKKIIQKQLSLCEFKLAKIRKQLEELQNKQER